MANSGDLEEIACLYERSFATLDVLPKLHTDGEGNEEKTPDVRYAWKPSA